jgi:glycosyltransferase involved in cell wall biosynthesis
MISIIIPTYNHKNELPQCLRSLKKQTYKDFEIIVVDDGSDYDVSTITNEFPFIRLYTLKHQGAPAARNFGFLKSKGEYVIFLDDDIILFPEMLGEMKTVLDNDISIAYVYSAFKLGKKTMRIFPFNSDLLKGFNFIHTSSLLRRYSFFGFDESLKKFQDWDLWLTLLEKNKYGKGIDKVLFKIINPRAGHMSIWLPKFVYRLPWKYIGFTPKVILDYEQAKKIIIQKHNLNR